MGQVLRLYHKSLDYKDLQMLQQLCVYSYAPVSKDESSCVFK